MHTDRLLRIEQKKKKSEQETIGGIFSTELCSERAVCGFLCFLHSMTEGRGKKYHSPITKNKYLCYIPLPLQ